MDELKQFWQQRAPRERIMLAAAGVFIVIFIIYSAIVKPVFDDAKRLKVQVAEQEKLLAWMQDAAQEAKRLKARSGGKVSTGSSGQSLLGIIDRTARISNLGDALKRVEPDGNSRVRVWLDRASFDDTVRWLESLLTRYDVQIESVVIDKEAAPGRVNVRLIFQGGAS